MLNERYTTSKAEAHAEGCVARAIENQTAKLPSDVFLWAAAGSIGLSLGLVASGRRHLGLFVGQWVSPLLICGLYNKIVKVAGSDRAVHDEDRPKTFDRTASAETVVEPDEPIRMELQNRMRADQAEVDDAEAYRRHADHEFGPGEFGISSVSDYPHDERAPTKPSAEPLPISRMP